jgi:micrococcal nuclease
MFRTTFFALAAFVSTLSQGHAETWIEGTVTHIRDVDTIEVANIPIRLNGLDGPELSEQGGKAAKDWMINLVAGVTLKCALNGDKTYDRLVGRCFLTNGTDIAALAVQQGHARDCPRYSGGRYAMYETRQSQNLIPHKYCR